MDFVEERDETSEDHNRNGEQLLDVGTDKRVAVQLQEIYRGGIVEKCSELKLSPINRVHHQSFTGKLQLSDQGTDGGPCLNSDTCCSFTKSELSSTADAAKPKPILDRPGYSLTITKGQRKYSCSPLNWNDPPPPNGSQVIISFTNTYYYLPFC